MVISSTTLTTTVDLQALLMMLIKNASARPVEAPVSDEDVRCGAGLERIVHSLPPLSYTTYQC